MTQSDDVKAQLAKILDRLPSDNFKEIDADKMRVIEEIVRVENEHPGSLRELVETSSKYPGSFNSLLRLVHWTKESALIGGSVGGFILKTGAVIAVISAWKAGALDWLLNELANRS